MRKRKRNKQLMKIKTRTRKDLEQLLNKEWAWGGRKKIQADYIKGIQRRKQECLVIEEKGFTEAIIGAYEYDLSD